MEDFELPDDLGDVEVIYSDGEDEDGINEEMSETEEIEQEVVDLAKFTFIKHTKSVFSSSVSNDSKLAVTGGEDDIAYVWAIESGEIILDCTGHKDSITEVLFNHNSQLIATGDMGGLIQVWSVNEKKLIWCFEGDDMDWLAWHPIVDVLICGCHSGDIYIWQIPQGNCKVLPSSNNSPTTCGKVLPNGKQLLASYDQGSLKLWDIKHNNLLWQNFQSQTITSFNVNDEGTMLILAPNAHLIKVSDGKCIATLLPDGETEIETALISSELNVVVTGSLSGQLCVWEIGRTSLRHQARIECAVTVMKFGPNGKIYVGATDGAIYVCDIKTGTLLETLTGHTTDILSISAINQNSILTTSDDCTAKIFNVNT